MTTVAKPAVLAPVKLIGNDGNAFAILAACRQAGRKHKYTAEQMSAFMKEATSGDYDNLLNAAMNWFDVR